MAGGINWWELVRGNRQGCPISPILFVLLVETLGIKIKTTGKIKGLEMFDFEMLLGQYADDLWVILEPNEQNVNNFLEVMEEFTAFAGLDINHNKTSILHIGPWKKSNAKFYTMKQLHWSDMPIKILGCWIYPDKATMLEYNFMNEIDKIKNTVKKWSKRNLTQLGKITVINSLVASKFMHKFLALPSPDQEFFAAMKKIFTDFLWNGKKSKIKYNKITQSYEEGGLKLVDLEAKNTALEASLVKKLKQTKADLRWFYSMLPIANASIWNLNISVQDIQKIQGNKNNMNISMEIWKEWSKFYYYDVETVTEIAAHIPWVNSHIHRQNEPFWNKQIIQSNVTTVADLFDFEAKRFKTCQQMSNDFGQVLDFVLYYALINAIPTIWKQKLKSEQVLVAQIDLEYKLDQTISQTTLSRTIYWDIKEREVCIHRRQGQITLGKGISKRNCTG